jgi:hypothetical protein
MGKLYHQSNTHFEFEGKFNSGHLDSFGIYKNSNDWTYKGGFKDGMPEGEGILITGGTFGLDRDFFKI